MNAATGIAAAVAQRVARASSPAEGRRPRQWGRREPLLFRRADAGREPRHVLARDPDAPPFIEDVERIGQIRIIRLSGPIDRTTVSSGYRYLARLLDDGRILRQDLLLDCRNVEAIDSSAIALLVVGMQEYLAEDHEVALLQAGRSIRSYLKLAQISHRVRSFDSEQAAVYALSANAASRVRARPAA